MDDPRKELFKRCKRQQAELEDARREHETRWRELAAWFNPRRNFIIDREPGALRQRRIVDTTAMIAAERLAALLQGYMMSPYDPWIAPMLINRDPARPEEEWFEATQGDMHRFLTGAQSSFRMSSYETLRDAVDYGNGVQEAGEAMKGGKIVFKSLPLIECFWRENEDCVIDTLHRKYKLPLYRAAAMYPGSKVAGKFSEKKNDGNDRYTFVRCVEPRAGGVAGASGGGKPFASVTYCEETEEVVAVAGYDDFPYQVFRIARQAGETYGTGFGWLALPLHRLLNAMSETTLHAADLNMMPPLLDLTGKLKSLDRRSGAVNSLTAAEAMLLGDGDILRRLHEPGDATIGVEMIRDIRRQIEMLYYIDWMSLPQSGVMTATEVNERRDIRLRSMTPLVARGESEFLNGVAERTFALLQRMNLLRQPPDSLDAEEIGWQYSSPLAMAQRQSTLEAIQRTFGALELAAAYDPSAVDVIDVKEALRLAASATGFPVKLTHSRERVAELQKKRDENAARERQIVEAQGAAAAARDAGQAAGSLRQAAA